MTLPFSALKDEWMKDPSFRAEYDALAPEFALSRALIEARANAGLTQADVPCRWITNCRDPGSRTICCHDHPSRQFLTISSGNAEAHRSAAALTSSRFRNETCGTRMNITTLVIPRPVRSAAALPWPKPPRLPVRARMFSATSSDGAPRR